ncbi:OmpW/AlkL family protein [Vogesella indigofera]|jgi:outer membrane protein|uniref:Outer membrane protein n=1 Tax=Vogesella indigofera TaxID=45465 RepID=A0A495BM66_VOGIN|nr:OmpW family outer membrane protein [Vogesella indigofera]RKQ62040.1 outer membrane protein [Vogesella indigofera]
MKKFAIAAILASLSAGAFAAQGDIIARLRIANVNPQTSVNDTLQALNVDVKDDTIPELDFTYMLTNNIGAELILGTSKHDITAGGAKIGSVKVLPPTLTLQYHFNPEGQFRPYAGAGINYTRFYGFKDDSGLGLSIKKNSFGPALQVGIDMPLTKDVFLNLDMKKIWIKTKVDSSVAGGNVGTLDINPLVTSVGIGMKF